MNRHAYLLLIHTNREQVRKLLSLLDDERNDIYVHIDAKSPLKESDFRDCCKHSDLLFVKRHRLSWGGVSIVRAEMTLLQEAVKRPYSYLHLLSGMDLPIKSNDCIHEFFAQNNGFEFLDLWQMEEHTLRRVRYFTPFPEGSHFFLTNWLNHAFKAVEAALGLEQNRNVEFAQGSQWFSITAAFARYVVDNSDWVEKTFRHCSICDEIFLPTLLMRSPFRDNIYRAEALSGHKIGVGNMRLIDWSRGPSIRHPWVFTSADYDLLMNAPQLWARKFDERVDAEIINKVCESLGKA